MRKLIVIIFLLICGCEQRTRPVPELMPPVTNNQRWLALAPYIRKHFDTGNKTDDEIAFEMDYAEYLMNEDRDGR